MSEKCLEEKLFERSNCEQRVEETNCWGGQAYDIGEGSQKHLARYREDQGEKRWKKKGGGGGTKQKKNQSYANLELGKIKRRNARPLESWAGKRGQKRQESKADIATHRFRSTDCQQQIKEKPNTQGIQRLCQEGRIRQKSPSGLANRSR